MIFIFLNLILIVQIPIVFMFSKIVCCRDILDIVLFNVLCGLGITPVYFTHVLQEGYRREIV